LFTFVGASRGHLCDSTFSLVTLDVVCTGIAVAGHPAGGRHGAGDAARAASPVQDAVAMPAALAALTWMPWPCLLHSELYLALQAVDLAAVVSLAAGADDTSLRLTAEVCVYLASVYLCVCCMALATPPVYIGQKIVRRYRTNWRPCPVKTAPYTTSELHMLA